MTAPKEEITLNRVLAWLAIGTYVIGVLIWVLSTQATAQRADITAKDAIEKLERKADKNETDAQLKRIFDKLDDIDKYLRDKK